MLRSIQPTAVVISPTVDWAFLGRVTSTGRSLMTVGYDSGVGIPPFPGELAYVGTTPRNWDVGLVRIRGATTDQLHVSENELEWRPGQWVYCPRNIPPLPRIQRVQDVGGTPTVWKDYDIAPCPLPPKVNIFATMFHSSPDALPVTVSAVPVEHGSSIVSVSLQAYPDGHVAGTGPYFVTFDGPGYKLLLAQATDSNGQTGRMYLPVLVDVANTADVIVNELTWGVREGVSVRLSAPLATRPPLAIAFLRFGVRECLLWLWSEESNLKFGELRTDLELLSSVALIDRMVSHAFVLESGARTDWYHVPSMTPLRAVHLLLEFHTTFNWTTPVVNNSVRMTLPIKAQSFSEGSVRSQLLELLDDALTRPVQFFSPAMHLWEEPLLLWDISDLPVTPVTPLEVRESSAVPVGEQRVGGFAYETPYLARYPGTTPDFWARKEEQEGLVVADQTDLNRLAGLLAVFNGAPEYHMPLAEDFHEVPTPYSLWETGWMTGTPQSVSARVEGMTVRVEATVKPRLPVKEGETISIPPAPPPTPPEYPIPDPPPPPPYGEGTAWILDRENGLYRTTEFYTTYPHWERVFTPDTGTYCAHFCYVERGGRVALAVATDRALYYLPDANAASVSQSDFVVMASEERLLNIFQSLFGLTAEWVEILWVQSLVHDSNYIGIMAVFRNGGPNYYNHTAYLFSNNWGETWSGFRTSWWTMQVYTRMCWWLTNTAGTNELLAIFGSGIAATPSYVYRSTDRGQNWVRLCDSSLGVAEPVKMRKPWQQGVNGGRVYKTGMPWGNPNRLGVSANNGCTFTEKFPEVDRYASTYHGMEYWTFDQYQVALMLWDKTLSQTAFFMTHDGGETFEKRNAPVLPLGGINMSTELTGNPANRNEWTVIVQRDLNPDFQGCVLASTLDGGWSWVDVTGDYRGFQRAPRWFLITPPFKVVLSRE